jgi:3-hydroxyisobutyrate dehydrogenase-like beta-hydroxyacid dehydrogenase
MTATTPDPTSAAPGSSTQGATDRGQEPCGAVGFVGLGQIGGPMAGRLVDWEGGFVVCDVRPEATAPLAERGAIVAPDVPALGRACELVSVMVRDDAQVRDVVRGLLEAAAPGTIIAIHSTIRAETAEELAVVAAGQGVHVLDVPVSGGFMGAHDGTLAAIVGGEREAYERAKPVFERWASLVVHMGPVGAGTRTKLARNLMHFAAYTAAGEAQRLAEAAGLDITKLARIVRHSDAVTGGPAAIMVRSTTAPLQPDDGLWDIFHHTRDLGEKDLQLALELADALGVDLPIGKLALRDFGTSLGLPPEA